MRLDRGQAESLSAALRHGEPPPLDAMAIIHGRRVVTADAVPLPPDGPVVIHFRTPVGFRSGVTARFPGPRTLISGLGNRISGLARWQDCRAEADWRAIADHVETLAADTADLREHRWARRSARQGGDGIPVNGWTGRLIVSGDLEAVLPLLALGTTCYAGSHATLGMGAYTLSWIGTDG